jgi:hypothetical protein
MIRHLRLIQLVGFVGLATLAMVGCGSDERQAPAPYEGSSTPDTAGGASGGAAAGNLNTTGASCENQQVRECHVILGAQGSVQNCFTGLQLCTSGEWGPCVDPSELEAQLNGQ